MERDMLIRETGEERRIYNEMELQMTKMRRE